MKNGVLRTGDPTDYLKSVLMEAPDGPRLLGEKLFELGDFEHAENRDRWLLEVAMATPQQVSALAGVIAPPLASSIGRAWKRLASLPITIGDWSTSNPSAAINRTIWLRDLFTELARFELPAKADDALIWLAIHAQTYARENAIELPSSAVRLVIGTHYDRLGATGLDHVGRLLASEIAAGGRVSENLFDTLRLVGIGRHPASSQQRSAASIHVVRGLAACGRDDALDVLCEIITVNRDDAESCLDAAITVVASALEMFPTYPELLPSIMETLAGEIDKATLPQQAIAERLTPLFNFPDQVTDAWDWASMLRKLAAFLRDRKVRQQALKLSDIENLYLALWAEAAADIENCGKLALERYREANRETGGDIRNLVRAFACECERGTLAMRPLWLHVLAESLGESKGGLNVDLAVSALNFNYASTRILVHEQPIPDDGAFEMLVELGLRLKKKSNMSQLVKSSSLYSANQINQAIVKLIGNHSVGKPREALLPFVDSMGSSIIPLLAGADFTQCDATTRAKLFLGASGRSPEFTLVMFGAVAAADPIDELVNWYLEYIQHESHDAIFLLACAMRSDRVDFWRSFLLSRKKKVRQTGLDLLTVTLSVAQCIDDQSYPESLNSVPAELAVDLNAIRRDASKVLDEYETSQSKQKNSDDLNHCEYRDLRRLARTDEAAAEFEANKRREFDRLCDRVAEKTGIDRKRFNATSVQPPRDRGIRFSDLVSEDALELLDTATQKKTQWDAEGASAEEQNASLTEWLDELGSGMSHADESEMLRSLSFYLRCSDWKDFDQRVFSRAKRLLSPEQTLRLEELRPPELHTNRERMLGKLILHFRQKLSSLKNDAHISPLDWYESVLANLPEAVQRLGPMANHASILHPPHSGAMDSVYRAIADQESEFSQRLWPLFWWAASLDGKYQILSPLRIGTAIALQQASLGDLVWCLIDGRRWSYGKENLAEAAMHPENFCPGLDANSESEIRAVIKAVADVCREQEYAVDPLLPPILAVAWQQLPLQRSQSDLCDILAKYADVDYRTSGRTTDQQKLFADRIGECLAKIKQTWADDSRQLNFGNVDAWRLDLTNQLRELLQKRTITKEKLLPIAMAHPVLLRPVLEATQSSHQLEAAIWILAHANVDLSDLAMTLDADTGHQELRHGNPMESEFARRMIEHYEPDAASQDKELDWPMSVATIRRSWKVAAIDSHPRKEISPFLTALRLVATPTNWKRVEGLLDAMDGKLDSPAQRKQLLSEIKDRPNLQLLQLGILPLPSDHDSMIAEISQRLEVTKAVWAAGSKRNWPGAKEDLQQAISQMHRTLANNAGLSDPMQLEWLSGAAIAKELAEFARIETGPYVIELLLRGDGPHVLVTNEGKKLKTIPAKFKSSKNGKRLTELQSRIKVSLRDIRNTFENAMVQQRRFPPDELKMMMNHPICAVIASQLVFVMEPKSVNSAPVQGLLDKDGRQILDIKKKASSVLRPVRIAHPVELAESGCLAAWQTYMTDFPPQAFQQLDRAVVKASDLKTVADGKQVRRYDGVCIKNEAQAIKLLEAHGWSYDFELTGYRRCFVIEPLVKITAVLDRFITGAPVGNVKFMDEQSREIPLNEIPSIILSEAFRDIDRVVAAAS